MRNVWIGSVVMRELVMGRVWPGAGRGVACGFARRRVGLDGTGDVLQRRARCVVLHMAAGFRTPRVHMRGCNGVGGERTCRLGVLREAAVIGRQALVRIMAALLPRPWSRRMARERNRDFPGNKSDLPSKPCVVCGRTMIWRRAWAKHWTEVLYCSERCRRDKAGAARLAAARDA